MLAVLVLASLVLAPSPPAASFGGVVSYAWGDPREHVGRGPLQLALRDPAGSERRLILPSGAALPALPLPRAARVAGSQPWLTLMCKFPDVAGEPRDLAYFTGMFSDLPGGLSHYWREVSYGQVDLAGSAAFGWVTMPRPQAAYSPTPGTGCLDSVPGNEANLAALFADCTAAADPFVDFSRGAGPGFAGIHLMFNAELDGCAWGGVRDATLDGVNKTWRATWEPPWAYAHAAVVAHEIGHGFGLAHSNNWDRDGSPFDNDWDVMSAPERHAEVDPTYGLRGKHTIAAHKDQLGWLGPGEVLTVTAPAAVTARLSDLALPPPVDGVRLIRIPVAGTDRTWTLEARGPTGLYDGSLPGPAVIVHELRPNRTEPAWCHDDAVPPGDFADGEGAMLRVGEVLLQGGVAVFVAAETADGFLVTVYSGAAPLAF